MNDCTVCHKSPGIWRSRSDADYYACDDCFADGTDLHEECGRWDNGRLVEQCRNAGTEDCAFCPYTR